MLFRSYFLKINSISFINNKSTTHKTKFQTTFLNKKITSYQTISNTQFINNNKSPILKKNFIILKNLKNPTKYYNLFYNYLFTHNTNTLKITNKHSLIKSTLLNYSFIKNNNYTIIKNHSPNFNYKTFYNNIYIYNYIFQQTKTKTIHNHLLNKIIQKIKNNLYNYKINHNIFTTPNYNIPKNNKTYKKKIILTTNSKIININKKNFQLSSYSPTINTKLNSIIQTFNLSTNLLKTPQIQNKTINLKAFKQPKLKLATLKTLPPKYPKKTNNKIILTTSNITPFSYQIINTTSQLITSNTQLLSNTYITIITNNSLYQNTLFFKIPTLNSINTFTTIKPTTKNNLNNISLNNLINNTPPYTYK